MIGLSGQIIMLAVCITYLRKYARCGSYASCILYGGKTIIATLETISTN